MKIFNRHNRLIDEKNSQENNNKNKLNILNYVKRKYAFGTLIAVLVLVLTLTFSNSSLVDKSYAAGNGWVSGGFDVDEINTTQNLGWSTGKFYINLYKGNTRFIAATFKVTKAVKFDSEGKHENWSSIANDSRYFSIDYNGTGVGDYKNWIKVGASSSTNYPTNSQGLTQSTDPGGYYYAAPTFKVKVPKGYYYSSGTKGHDTSKFPNGTVLVPVYCKSTPYIPGEHDYWDSDKCSWVSYPGMMFADSPKAEEDGASSSTPTYTARAEDRWASGRLSINIAQSTGVVTLKSNVTGKFYRHRQSYTIKFLPRTTSLTFNANGGSGGPTGTKTKTYDTALILSTSNYPVPTRSGYTFLKWCTKQDGSGDCYGSGDTIPGAIWPGDSTKTLYAQWRKTTSVTDADWCGYTVASTQYSNVRAWRDGRSYVHLAKCDINESSAYDCEPYSSTRIDSLFTYTASTSGSNAYYTHMKDNSLTANYSLTNGDTANFNLVATSAKTAKTSFNGNSASTFIYMNGPTVKVRIPKGYKYWTYLTPYPSDLWTGNSELSIRVTSGSGTHPILLESNPGPAADDNTWVQGSLTLNTGSVGHKTISGYRVYKAQCIAFKPNSRKVYYRGNGSDNSPDEMGYDTYVYDDEEVGLVIADNEYERSGYEFVGWNTATDGSGTWYEEGQVIPGNKWPSTESNLNLYAIWSPLYNGKIYYNASSGDGTTDVQNMTLSCSPGKDTSEVHIYVCRESPLAYAYVTDNSDNPLSNIPLQFWSGDPPVKTVSRTTNEDGYAQLGAAAAIASTNPVVSLGFPYGFDDPVELPVISNRCDLEPIGDYATYDARLHPTGGSGTSCKANIPAEVVDSVGQYNNSYAGLASNLSTMTAAIDSSQSKITLTSVSATPYYSIYSEPVTNYYYSP